jgi:hypothetical protein
MLLTSYAMEIRCVCTILKRRKLRQSMVSSFRIPEGYQVFREQGSHSTRSITSRHTSPFHAMARPLGTLGKDKRESP